MDTNSDKLWGRDDVQFPRLISELKAVGLTEEQMKALAASMDLDRCHIHEILDRGEEVFEAIKEMLDCVDTDCVMCGKKLVAEQQGTS